jgi:tetratricopeptide (TPR) repeat protein
MTLMRSLGFTLGVLALGTVLLSSADSDFAAQERLWRYRILGKAFYENPTTQVQAVEQLQLAYKANPKSVVDQLNYGLALLRAARTREGIVELEAVQKADPKIPHTWFNLGIEYKKQSEPEKAIQQLEGMARLVPDEPITQYNLGVLYKLVGRAQDANDKFELAAKLDPNFAAPHFQLFNVYRQTGKKEDAQKQLQRFQEIKKQQEAAGTGSEDVEWCRFSELLEVIDPNLAVDSSAGAALKFAAAAAPGAAAAATAQVRVFDADGDGAPDVLVTSAAGVKVLKRGLTPMPMPAVKDVLSAAVADYDNDGLMDIVVLTANGPVLLQNSKAGFEIKDAGLPAGRFETAVWVDYDHDYDQDLLLLGQRSVLMRNQGTAGFADRTQDFPFQPGAALSATGFRLIPDSKSLDVVVSYQDHSGVLYRDLLGGRYEAITVASIPAGVNSLAALDANNDSFVDVAFRGGLALNNEGKFGAGPQSADHAYVYADLENRGLLDLAMGPETRRSKGLAQWDAPRAAAGLTGAAALAAADFDGDGRTDLFAVKPDGTLARFTNQTPLKNNWLRVQLTGIKNLKLAPGAEIEVKTGALYEKRLYTGVPLLFGLRGYAQADTVRITWPNGLIQNEMKQAGLRAYKFEEAQRLSGSCPVIWTWNGREFEYITDVLGVAPLGAASGDGSYFPTDHDEYIQIRGDQLRQVDGAYEVRISEELSEVSYLDQVHLIAVDHPGDVEIFTNDKWKSPPYPEFRLFGTRRRVEAVKATDDDGSDVARLVSRRDRRYPEGFRREMNGVARMHSLTLDFGSAAPDNKAVLILSGWVDWADGSTFLSQAQESRAGLAPPQLQVKNAHGGWVTVLADMGMPAGKPKTIAVDMTGKFLSQSREVRIVTNLCVYWDEIFLSEDSSAPEVVLTALPPARTDLRFRGFSEAVVHPQRRQPEQFLYARPAATSLWNPTPGMYTRYGEVTPLLKEIDDRFVIMGSGDELQLKFAAVSLPPLRAGWKRDFLLKVDGWAKDRDANTAFSQSVEPLPFHSMSAYPYPKGEQYPSDELHEAYRKEYNTRPALRLLRPLTLAGTRTNKGAP